jgi:hypothetical protein
LTFSQTGEPGTLNSADVHEHVTAPPSGWINPKPVWLLNHFTVPVDILFSRSQRKTCAIRGK